MKFLAEKRMLQARKSRGERLLGRVRLLGEIRYVTYFQLPKVPQATATHATIDDKTRSATILLHIANSCVGLPWGWGGAHGHWVLPLQQC